MQLFVIGMHRSGTSAVARILNMMGAYFGEEGIAMPPTEDNPKGYWERKDIVTLNEKILHAAGSTWCQVADFSVENIAEPVCKEFEQKACTILLDLDAHRPWIVKDPRFCLTFPLWRKLLEMPICVFVYRSPLEVAQSINVRDGYPCTETSIPLNAGIALWEKYNLAALDAIKGLPTIFISHRSLMENPVEAVKGLYDNLISLKLHGIRMPEEKEITSFIAPSLYRQRTDNSVENEFLNRQQVALLATLKDKSVPAKLPGLSAGALSVLQTLEKQSVLEQERRNLNAHAQNLEEQLTARNKELDKVHTSFSEQLAARNKELVDIQVDYKKYAEESMQAHTRLHCDLNIKKRQVQELIAYFERLHHYFEIIFDSITWKTGFLSAQIIRKLTRRPPEILLQDRVADLAIEFCNRKEEYANTLQDNLSTPLLVASPKRIKLADLPPPVIVTEDSTVSVVIPTLNAGNDFATLLSMLKAQDGIKSMEIIIVDSGSTDNTIELAGEYGCTLVQISQEQFSHSYSRNLGIEKATGKYTLVMTQDALPPTSYWLCEMLKALKDNHAVAVSCDEFSREDADLFYRISSWNHGRFLGVDKGDRVMVLPDSQDYASLRKNSQLSDIACLTETDLIKKYKYRNDYAEDLDLGMRLIRDGYKIAFLGSTKIIHSHNRPAYYHLKRAYVDNLTLDKIFPDFPKPSVSFDTFLHDILFTYETLDDLLCNKLKRISFPCSVEVLLGNFNRDLQEALSMDYSFQSSPQIHEYVDDDFGGFIQKIGASAGVVEKRKYDGVLIPAMLGFMGGAAEYFNNTYELIDEQLCDEFIECIYKAFAYQVGAHLLCWNKEKVEGELTKMNSIFTELTRGV